MGPRGGIQHSAAIVSHRRTIQARSAALLTLVVGLIGIVAAQMLAPLPAPPLYDGVVPVEAYRWLTPPPGEHGGAQGATATLRVSGGSSPLVAVATPEPTPQAQIFAQPGALILASGTTSITVSITPVPPDALPTVGRIAGNVYRITIVDQSGAPVSALASAEVSVSLRDPNPAASEATMNWLSNGAWVPLRTDASGLGAIFNAVVTDFGDFALVEPGEAASPAGSPAGSAGSSPGASESAGPAVSIGPAPSAVPLAPEPGIPTVTIVAGIGTALVLAALIVLALLPRRRKRQTWGERPKPGSRRPRR